MEESSKCPPVEASSISTALRVGKRTRPSSGPNKPFASFSLCKYLSFSFQHLPLKTLIHRTVLTTFFVFIWKTIQRLMHSKSLLFAGLYPFTGAMYLFLVMPLATCFAFPQDLPSNVNPLKPKDYVFLIKKTWFAMKRNNFKVEGKDL